MFGFIVMAPRHVADGLSKGTDEHKGLTWRGLVATLGYSGLIAIQFLLFISNRMFVESGALWLCFTLAGTSVTAYFTGFPLVCSGVA